MTSSKTFLLKVIYALLLSPRSFDLRETDIRADWGDEDTDLANGGEASAHLWEESWDDDDKGDDFAKLLQEELKRVGDGKK